MPTYDITVRETREIIYRIFADNEHNALESIKQNSTYIMPIIIGEEETKIIGITTSPYDLAQTRERTLQGKAKF